MHVTTAASFLPALYTNANFYTSFDVSQPLSSRCTESDEDTAMDVIGRRLKDIMASARENLSASENSLDPCRLVSRHVSMTAYFSSWLQEYR